ncbi:hypothetical protein QQS21_003662 [Conoideocrella luteorostrata]|uniref:Uncharacterized protein n=1 Tax=Conoideocrella luteorostrata TaxID=1105319 RepID=A0AAJ0CSV2_9HYPO|nr:hypothetical protein QQS21_003662 [Conoideocrella luteorostrata]
MGANSNKTVLVTGCSSGGIGAAICLALARRGHHIIATARTVSKIPTELSGLDNVTLVPLDVTSDESVTAAIATVSATNRTLDVVVNNAGVGYAMPVLDVDIDRCRQVYKTNVWGPVRVIKAFAPLLIASHGRFVNISTVGSILNCPWIATYTSSKAALTAISDTLRLELQPLGVEVVTIQVGIVDSFFHDNDTKFILPKDSIYSSISSIIAGWASGASKPKGISAVAFAEQIVDQIVGHGKTGIVFRGPTSRYLDYIHRYLPQYFTDVLMSYNQGLKELHAEKQPK